MCLHFKNANHNNMKDNACSMPPYSIIYTLTGELSVLFQYIEVDTSVVSTRATYEDRERYRDIILT